MKAGDFQQNLAALSQDGRVNPLCPFTKDYHTSVCLSRLRSSEFLVQYFPSYKRLELSILLLDRPGAGLLDKRNSANEREMRPIYARRKKKEHFGTGRLVSRSELKQK